MTVTIYQLRDEATAKSGIRYVVKFESPYTNSATVGFKGISEIVEFLVRSGVKQDWVPLEDSLRVNGYWSGNISLPAPLETSLMVGALRLPGV